MATFKTETYTAQEAAADNAASYIDTADLISGKVQFLQCSVTIPSGTAQNDTILVGYLPSGVTIIPGQITITKEVTCGANSFSVAAAVAGLRPPITKWAPRSAMIRAI